jgi:hypothetical protein
MGYQHLVNTLKAIAITAPAPCAFELTVEFALGQQGHGHRGTTGGSFSGPPVHEGVRRANEGRAGSAAVGGAFAYPAISPTTRTRVRSELPGK